MLHGASRCSDVSAGENINAAALLPLKWRTRFLHRFSIAERMDSSLFEFWFSNQLLPSLDKDTVIVMDNASFHSKKRLISAA